MGFDFSTFKRKNKRSGGSQHTMLAERMRRFGAFAALAMFVFASVSTSQLMFLELENTSDISTLYSSSRSTDSDSDGILDLDDACPTGNNGWTSNSTTDHDSDGCQDSNEDQDDDNDTITDQFSRGSADSVQEEIKDDLKEALDDLVRQAHKRD